MQQSRHINIPAIVIEAKIIPASSHNRVLPISITPSVIQKYITKASTPDDKMPDMRPTMAFAINNGRRMKLLVAPTSCMVWMLNRLE